jgi:hypothetical protein
MTFKPGNCESEWNHLKKCLDVCVSREDFELILYHYHRKTFEAKESQKVAIGRAHSMKEDKIRIKDECETLKEIIKKTKIELENQKVKENLNGLQIDALKTDLKLMNGENFTKKHIVGQVVNMPASSMFRKYTATSKVVKLSGNNLKSKYKQNLNGGLNSWNKPSDYL